MTDQIDELYDYDELRRRGDATMFVLRVQTTTVVLGGNQTSDVLDGESVSSVQLRRRRGGGGLVVLQPGDLWIDWWVPAHDPRWRADVRVSSIQAGHWWRQALAEHIGDEPVVHEGGLEGEATLRVVCFTGKGPGEVFVGDRKAVGLTQWRVREGVFISTVLHAQPSRIAIDVLREAPEGLAAALEHHTISSLGIVRPQGLVDELAAVSGPWLLRSL